LLNPLAVLDESVLRMEPLETQADLDSCEAKYRRAWKQTLNRILSSWNESNVLLDSFYVSPQNVETLRSITRGLANLTRDLGRTRARKELTGSEQTIRFAVMPELPTQADEILDRFLTEIPFEAKRIVKEEIAKGGGIKEAMGALRVEFPVWAKPKMERVARTVASYHFNVGRLEVFKDAGVKHYFVSAILDNRICPICYGVDGLVIDMDADLRSYPPLHWNCRCVVVPKVDYGGQAITTEEELKREASKRLREIDFRLGQKLVTIWPGVPAGWGEQPKAQLPERLRTPPALPQDAHRGTLDVSAVLGIGILGVEALRAIRNILPDVRELARLIKSGKYRFTTDEIIAEMMRRYNVARTRAVKIAILALRKDQRIAA
jgi:SPP1 gp7 family putative phage head morphogenesis protein